MIDIAEFPKHLESIRVHDWQRLFDLNDRIIQSKSFSEFNDMDSLDANEMAMPYWNWTEITYEFIKILHDLSLLPIFDWGAWPEGYKILDNPDQNFDNLDNITLCKLLTLIVSSDRLDDGYLVFQFGNGTISKIISSLKNHVLLSVDTAKGALLKQGHGDIRCAYCGITESEIKTLFDISEKLYNKPLTKNLHGKRLELDRRDTGTSYSNLENIIYVCYWCNSAKTDTFTHEEFLEIGKVIGKIWKQRLG